MLGSEWHRMEQAVRSVSVRRCAARTITGCSHTASIPPSSLSCATSQSMAASSASLPARRGPKWTHSRSNLEYALLDAHSACRRRTVEECTAE